MSNPPRYAVVAMREWAKEEMRAETCPPWTFYRLMQLLDALSVLEHGTEAVTPMDHLPESETPEDEPSPQEGNIYRLGAAQSHHVESSED